MWPQPSPVAAAYRAPRAAAWDAGVADQRSTGKSGGGRAMSIWLGVAADPQAVSATARAGAERLLSDAARRAATPGLAPPELVALAVRLAAVPPPGPQPHHHRVARAMLDEAAQHHGGQVFALGNGDLVLLAPAAALRAAGRGDPLPDTLGRLLGDVGSGLVTVWRLPVEREHLLAY